MSTNRGWANTPELRKLLARAEAYGGASDVTLSHEDSTRDFVTVKDQLFQQNNASNSSSDVLKLYEVILEQIKLQSEQSKRQSRQIERLIEVVEENGTEDCYDNISANSEKIAKLSKKDYTDTYSVNVADLQCMMTGHSHTTLGIVPNYKSSPIVKDVVTLAHLLPRSASGKLRIKLGLEQSAIENIRNSILLCKGIEEAFDQKQLSFVPADNPFSPNRYKLYIWDDSIRNKPIYEGSKDTIGSLDGFPLNLTINGVDHDPYKRVLSYQVYRAHHSFGKGASDFPVDCDTSVYNGKYKADRIKYLQKLQKDIAEELDNEDEDEND